LSSTFSKNSKDLNVSTNLLYTLVLTLI